MFSAAAAVSRGDTQFPRFIEDTFARSLAAGLGRTEVGNVPWKTLRGEWKAVKSRAHVDAGVPSPVALVNARFADLDIEVDVSNQSGDALVLRASRDGTSYLRLSAFYDVDVEIQTAEEYLWSASYGNPGSSSYTEYEWRATYGGYAIPGWHTHPDPGDPVAEQGSPIVKTQWSQSNSSCPLPTNFPGHPAWAKGAAHSHLVYSDDFTVPNIMSTHKHPMTSCVTTGNTRQRTYSPPAHTHAESGWSRSSSTSPLGNSLTHSHGIGTHTHPRSSTSVTASRTVETGRIETPVRRVHLEQVDDGVVTELGSWAVDAPISSLRAIAAGSTVEVRANGVLVSSQTVAFNQTEKFHGVGRRGGGIEGSDLTNFRISRL